MSKMLLMTMIALAALATTAMPTASACQWEGTLAKYENYVVCGYGDVHDASAAVAFLTSGSTDVVGFVQSTELYGLLP